jgi:hypothetical protein
MSNESNTVTCPATLLTLLKSFNGCNFNEDGKIDIRLSKKQCWFIFVKAKEAGMDVSADDDGHLQRECPSVIQIGTFSDGSKCFAEFNLNRVNGPFWLTSYASSTFRKEYVGA